MKKIKEKKISNNVKFEKLQIGKKFSFKRKIKFEDIIKFANLVKDKNPLHTKPAFGKKEVISHGMFVGSLTSALLGTYFPINNNLILSMSLNFNKPVYSNDSIKIEGIIKDKSSAFKIVTVKINIYKKDKLLVEGEAKLKVL